MSKIGEVVLSARDIASLDERCRKASKLADRNYKRHQKWYADFCAREQAAHEGRQKPQERVAVRIEGAVRKRHRPGTLGDLLASKVR